MAGESFGMAVFKSCCYFGGLILILNGITVLDAGVSPFRAMAEMLLGGAMVASTWWLANRRRR